MFDKGYVDKYYERIQTLIPEFPAQLIMKALVC